MLDEDKHIKYRNLNEGDQPTSYAADGKEQARSADHTIAKTTSLLIINIMVLLALYFQNNNRHDGYKGGINIARLLYV